MFNRCVGVNTDDLLNQIRDIFTIENFNNVVEWLKDYWWIVLIVGLVIIGICIALPLTYRKKKPIRRMLRKASTYRRQPSTSNDANIVAAAQAGGIGAGTQQRVARRRDQSRQPVLTASEYKFRKLTRAETRTHKYALFQLYLLRELCIKYLLIILCTENATEICSGKIILIIGV